MRTLHHRGLDKRQTLYPGEAQGDLTRFVEDFIKLFYRPRRSIHSLRGRLKRGRGEQEFRPPVAYRRYGRADLDVRIS